VRKITFVLFLTGLTLGWSLTASAQHRRISAADYGGHSQQAVSAALGFYAPGAAGLTDKINGSSATASPVVSGLFGIGGDYEYSLDTNFTIGGLVRYYSTSDSTTDANTQTVSGWTLSGLAKAYFPSDRFLPYLGAGVGLVSMELKNAHNGATDDYNPSATIGFSYVMGLLYKIDDRMAFGVESLRVIALGEKLNGTPISDFMFKGRFSF
jgi:opacity protein-like surface antigen